MKKFNITSEKLAIIAFSIVQTLCIFIAAAYALQEPSPNVYYDMIGALIWLIIAGVFEWFKYKITHADYEDTKES